MKYNENEALERKVITDGKNIMDYVSEMEEKHPGCVIIMIDWNTKEEYRLN